MGMTRRDCFAAAALAGVIAYHGDIPANGILCAFLAADEMEKEAKRRDVKTIVCAACGQEAPAMRSHKQYCGNTCSQRVLRSRKKETAANGGDR